MANAGASIKQKQNTLSNERFMEFSSFHPNKWQAFKSLEPCERPKSLLSVEVGAAAGVRG